MPQFNIVAIVGCGLIGGSFGLALKQHKLARHIIGFDLDADMQQQALQCGAIDQIGATLTQSVTQADLVILATPVGSFASLCAQLQEIQYCNNKFPLFTDLGSTKQQLADVLQLAKPEFRQQFVLGHPIAGRELSGVANAKANLYTGALVLLTPLPQTSSEALASIKNMWQALQARVQQLEVSQHDSIYSSVSHLPHLVAYAYLQALLQQQGGDEHQLVQLLQFAGTGFRDFSRIAGGDAVLWRDVLLANKHHILSQTQQFVSALTQLVQLIEQDKADELLQILQQMSRLRRDFVLQSN